MEDLGVLLEAWILSDGHPDGLAVPMLFRTRRILANEAPNDIRVGRVDGVESIVHEAESES